MSGVAVKEKKRHVSGERTFDRRRYSSVVTPSATPFTFSSSGVGAVGVWWEWNALL